MRHRTNCRPALMLAGLALLLLAASDLPAQAPQVTPAPAAASPDLSVRGKVIRIDEPHSLMLIRTADGRELKLYRADRTVVRWGDRAVPLGELPVGTDVTVAYNVVRDRPIMTSVLASAPALVPPARDVVTVRGRVVKVQADPNRLILRSDDGRDLVIYMEPDTRIQVGDKDVRLVNLLPGTEVAVSYELRPVATTVRTPEAVRVPPPAAVVTPAPATVVAPAPPAATPTTVVGSVVRVQAPEHWFALRTADGKEMRFRLNDRSTVRLSDRAIRLADLPVGSEVRVAYDARNGEYFVTSLEGPVAVTTAPAAVAVVPAAGRVQGVVLEGDLVQPALNVVLRTDTGREIASAKTAANGTFAFTDVAPGLYRLFCSKPSTQRVAETPVTVEAGKAKDVTLRLIMPPAP